MDSDDAVATPAEQVVVVRFAVSDPSLPFVGASKLGRIYLERMLPRKDGRYAEFFSVRGIDPDSVLELASTDERVEGRLIDRYEDGGLVEFSVSGFCPARELAELGAIPTEAGGEDGEGWIEAEIPRTEDAAVLVDRFLDRHPSIELTSKRTQPELTPLFSPAEFNRALDQRLTERQQEVMRAAYEAGFYDQPRAVTAQELAEELGISGATFSQHRRAAERKLVSLVAEARMAA